MTARSRESAPGPTRPLPELRPMSKLRDGVGVGRSGASRRALASLEASSALVTFYAAAPSRVMKNG